MTNFIRSILITNHPGGKDFRPATCIMQLFKTFHLMLAFTLELALLAALGYWGFHNRKMPEKYLLGVGAPILAVILWWIWAAPKSANRLQQPGLLLFKISLFGLAAFGLYRSGQSGPALLLMVLAVLSAVWEFLWF